MSVRRLVDVVKPHDSPLLEFVDQLPAVDSVDEVSATLIELDWEGIRGVALHHLDDLATDAAS